MAYVFSWRADSVSSACWQVNLPVTNPKYKNRLLNMLNGTLASVGWH